MRGFIDLHCHWIPGIDDGARTVDEGVAMLERLHAAGFDTVVATPHLKDSAISIIDMTDWHIIKTIKTDGPGFFLRSHENTPYIWADVSGGKSNDRMHIIDKRTLEIVRTIVPQPGSMASHVEFDRDGKHAFGNLLVDRLQLLAKIFAKRCQVFHFSLRCSESGFVARRVSGGIAGLLCIAMDALDFLCGR